MKNKFILITGANGFIGSMLAEELSKLGLNLILTDKDKSNIKKNILKKSLFIKCDLSSKIQTRNLILRIKKQVTKLDVIINNAAATGDILKSEPQWEKVFRINLFSVFEIFKGLEKKLLKSNRPSIINIASIYGSNLPNFEIYKNTKIFNPPEYSSSKAALIYLTKWMAKKYKKIRINSISPGGVFRKQNKKFVNKYIKKTNLNRMAKEKDIINLIIFLISDDSIYINGQNIVLDSGFTL